MSGRLYSSLNDPANLIGRIEAAAFHIRNDKGLNSRELDNCFENGDGDKVLSALVGRAFTDKRLAANLPIYMCPVRLAEEQAKWAAMTAPDWSAIDNREAEARAKADRDRLLIRVMQSSPNRKTVPQADAGHLPLFIAANEPTLF